MNRMVLLMIACGLHIGLSQTAFTQEHPQKRNEASHAVPYCPNDIEAGHLIYRVQTGQAGLFRTCNDDHLKRYSPYVEWRVQPTPQRSLISYEISSVFKDLKERWFVGIGEKKDATPTRSGLSGMKHNHPSDPTLSIQAGLYLGRKPSPSLS